METTFYKKCKCKTISGFSLTTDRIDKNEKYICQECVIETELNKWSNASEQEYFEQVRDRLSKERLEKLNKSRMKNVVPKNKRSYK